MLSPIEGQTRRDRDRIVNLSDGGFAIAITLLVLDIRAPDVPENMVPSQLPAALLSLWPDYLGSILSVVGISTFWLIHRSIFRPIRAYDRNLLYLNFLFLMVVAFVPFPTSLLGEYGDHQLPVAIYAATLAVDAVVIHRRFRWSGFWKGALPKTAPSGIRISVDSASTISRAEAPSAPIVCNKPEP